MSKSNQNVREPADLKSWAELTQVVHLPVDIGAAIMTGRSELLRVVCRPLSEAETVQVMNLLAVLIDTNNALQAHSRDVAEMAKQTLQLLSGAETKLQKVVEFANFRQIEDDDG